MVAERWCLDGLVDEIPNLHTPFPAHAAQPLLVVLNLARRSSVCLSVLCSMVFKVSWVSIVYRVVAGTGTDVRSEDEDDGDADADDDKED